MLLVEDRTFLHYRMDGKKHKPFSPSQVTGVIILLNGRRIHWNCFCNSYNISTALIGDSILRHICIDRICTYSIPGGRIEDFLLPEVQVQLCPHETVIVGSIGGNDLTDKRGVCLKSPMEVFHDLSNVISHFVGRMFVMTLLQRRSGLNCFSELNKLLDQSALITYKPRRKLHRLICWEADDVHLSLQGRKNFCKAVSELRKSSKMSQILTILQVDQFSTVSIIGKPLLSCRF